MITDNDVSELYRCLLGRAPETPDTVAAFKSYYPDFAKGRRAILHSAEFAQLMRDEQSDTASLLAQAFLRRAAGDAVAEPDRADAAVGGAMQLVVRAHGHVQLAVIAGELDVGLNDLLPLDSAQAAVLRVTGDRADTVPRIGFLQGGATVFRTGFTAEQLVGFLREAGLRIDLLALSDAQSGWLPALRDVMAPRAVLLADAPLTEAAEWPGAEREVAVGTLYLRCVGGWFLPVSYMKEATEPPVAPIPGLCIAAITRNEEVAAPNMLASVAGIAESFVIVDTGSTDATVPRVDAALRAIGKPYVLASSDAKRFDDMRNAALDLVPASARWVLMLDADEELCPADHAALRALLENPDREAYALPRYNYTGADKSGEVTPYPDRQVRLLRHRAENPIRYSGAVHETITGVDIGLLPLDATVLGQGAGGPHIHHLVRRFRSPAEEAAKQERYRVIAKNNK